MSTYRHDRAFFEEAHSQRDPDDPAQGLVAVRYDGGAAIGHVSSVIDTHLLLDLATLRTFADPRNTAGTGPLSIALDRIVAFRLASRNEVGQGWATI